MSARAQSLRWTTRSVRITGRPCSTAMRAWARAPLCSPASTTTVPGGGLKGIRISGVGHQGRRYPLVPYLDLAATDDGTEVTMTMEPLHVAEWTQRLVAGRSNELDNLAAVLDGRS
jgi:hypothetical protein